MPSVFHDHPLSQLHTFGTQVFARKLLNIDSTESLLSCIKEESNHNAPLLVMGGGSNILFTQDFQGTILLNNIKGITVERETAEHIWIKIGGGENWHQTVQYCVERNWGGIENLSLIPGKVGASPIQNIGAYGVELVDVFEYLEAIELHTGLKKRFDQDTCEFGYRNSFFKNEGKGRFFITHVCLRLLKKPRLNTSYGAIAQALEAANINKPGIQDLSKIICEIRRSKLPDPSTLGNAGSFFKNPVIDRKKFLAIEQKYEKVPNYPQEKNQVKLAAGWLIQECGWKGYRDGNIGVHEKQALVLVNYGGAKGKDIYELSLKIQSSVKEHFGIILEHEVNIL